MVRAPPAGAHGPAAQELTAHPPRWLRDASGCQVAVLGAGGFIGSRVVGMALAAGARRVSAIVLGDPWRLREVADRRLHRHRLAGAPWWSADAQPELSRHLAGADVLALLAYEPPPAPDRPVQHELGVNAVGAYRVATTAAAGTRVVFASSAEVYGHRHRGAVGEATAPDPATPYAVAKVAAEHLVALASPGAVRLRIATVFGPGENGPRAIPSFIRALLSRVPPVVHGGGDDVRDYVHVDDVAAAVLNAGVTEAGGALNIGSGRGRTTLEVLGSVQAALGPGLPPVHTDPGRPGRHLVLDSSQAAGVLGFEPREDFDAAVAAEADWLRGYLARGVE